MSFSLRILLFVHPIPFPHAHVPRKASPSQVLISWLALLMSPPPNTLPNAHTHTPSTHGSSYSLDPAACMHPSAPVLCFCVCFHHLTRPRLSQWRTPENSSLASPSNDEASYEHLRNSVPACWTTLQRRRLSFSTWSHLVSGAGVTTTLRERERAKRAKLVAAADALWPPLV